MADFTGIISQYIENRLSEKEKNEFAEKLKTDKDFFQEYIFQKNITDFMQKMYFEKVLESSNTESDENSINKLIENWSLTKNSTEDKELAYLIDNLIDEHETEQIEKNIEILEIESGSEEIDSQIDKMIESENKSENDLEFQSLISDVINETENNNQHNIQKISSTDKTRNYKLIYSIAAVILLLITLTTFLVVNNKPDGKKLFAQYYTNSIITEVTRDTSNVAKLQNDAANFLIMEDYKSASEIYCELLKTSPEEVTYYLNQAICFIELEDFEKAEKLLIDCRLKFPNSFIKATWYLGLCYLYTEDYEKAITEFEKIKETDTYKDLPQQIIEKIK